MRSEYERAIVLDLAKCGVNQSMIARVTFVPRSTVREWLKPDQRCRERRDPQLNLASLPQSEYSYLLGFYLGDGSISRHLRGVHKLRIVCDSQYVGIIDECAAAMQAVMPKNRVSIQKLPYNAVVIGCYSKTWPVLFPQHGPGRKHTRRIELAAWQQAIVDRYPKQFLRGLIHSDGCRVLNHVNGKGYPRYFFSQVSDDIRNLFCETCDRLGVQWRLNRWNSVSIARAPSVAILDSFIGPKS
jgi:hypothetical protein